MKKRAATISDDSIKGKKSALSSVWEARWSTRKLRVYYFNAATGQSTWTLSSKATKVR